MVKGSSIYLLAISLGINSIFFGQSPIGIWFIPGKSIRVKSGHICEYIYNIIGLSTIFP